jgi:hypothetical protein
MSSKIVAAGAAMSRLALTTRCSSVMDSFNLNH